MPVGRTLSNPNVSVLTLRLLGRWVLPRQDPSTTTIPPRYALSPQAQEPKLTPYSAPAEAPSSAPSSSYDPTVSDPAITLDWAACHVYETCDTSGKAFWKCPDGSVVGLAQTCPPIVTPWSACHDPPTATNGCKVDPVGVPRLWGCADGSTVAEEAKCPEADPNRRVGDGETSSSSSSVGSSTPSSTPDGQRAGGTSGTGETGSASGGSEAGAGSQGQGQGQSGAESSQQSQQAGGAIFSTTTLASGPTSVVRVGSLSGVPSGTFQRTASAGQTSNAAVRSNQPLGSVSKAQILSAGVIVFCFALGMAAVV
jgi:hypothetical protein